MAQMLAMVCNEHHRMPITTPLAPPRASPPVKSILDACRASLSPSLIDHTVVYIRTSIATNSPIATLLASANNVRMNVTRTTRPHRRSGKRAQLRPLRCPPPPPPTRVRRMGLGLVHRRHYPPRFAERCRQQSPQRETLAVLDWTLQDTRCWSRPSRRHP